MIAVLPRRQLWQAAAVSILAPIVGAPGTAFAQLPTGDSVKRGGTLTMLLDPEPPTLVSAGHTAGPTKMLSPKVLEGLLTYDFDLNPLPQLATAWTGAPDGLSYTFILRRGVKFHDGRDFTSADAAFSIWLAREVHPNGRATFQNVTEIATPDPNTMIVRLSKPNLALITALAANETPMVPKHIYEGQPYMANPANAVPIGTGPFVFREWIRGSHITYDRNPNYWDQPRPYIDRLVVKLIPDSGAAVAAFETGEVDLGFNNPVPLSEIDRLKALPHLAIETRGYEYNAPLTMFIFNLDNPILKNLKVRQAIAHTIDREAILQTVWFGYGVSAAGPISPRLKRYFANNLPVFKVDTAVANQLLDEAGFPRGASGIRFDLTHDFLPYGPIFKRVAEYLKQAFARIGIRLNIRSQDFASYIKRVYTDRDFDTVNAWLSSGYDPTGAQRYFWSKNFKKGLPFSNTAHYDNPEVDQLLEEAAVTPDLDRRIALYQRLQHIIVRDLPEIDLVSQTLLTVYNKRVHAHTITADGINGNFAYVYLDRQT
jgi:peptide/nickel transport system substrate-binding protein